VDTLYRKSVARATCHPEKLNDEPPTKMKPLAY
jgi:hypothetical protein